MGHSGLVDEAPFAWVLIAPPEAFDSTLSTGFGFFPPTARRKPELIVFIPFQIFNIHMQPHW